jgi:hypothetical protein
MRAGLCLKQRIDAAAAVKPHWDRRALEQLEELDESGGCHY